MATASLIQDFDVSESSRALGLLPPMRLGRKLWAPMLLMAVMAFPVAAVLGIVRASLVADGDSPDTVALLGQLTTAVMFIGFATVLAAIVFAIARILGALRTGGGEIQEAVGGKVVTLNLPGTAKLMIVLMMMAMMGLVFAVIVHIVLGFVAADAVNDGNAGRLATISDWSTWMEAVRRLSVAVYLTSVSLGLATIVRVLRFQAARIRELAGERTG
ncbi:MAG: hypothetical protein O3A47_00695 [Chloroflexi bacterium]|nr:hypothetical protein [Chloroflexota bacterium]